MGYIIKNTQSTVYYLKKSSPFKHFRKKFLTNDTLKGKEYLNLIQHLLHPYDVKRFSEFCAGIIQPADFSKPMICMKTDTFLVF